MTEQLTPKERVLATMRRVLEQTTLRAILRPLGQTPLDVNPDEKERLLEPYRLQIENDFVMCCEVAEQLVSLSYNAKPEIVLESTTLRLSSEE